MLRRLLFFLFVFCTVIGGFAQTFTLEAEQSLNASKDSLVVSIYIQSTADDQLGNSDFVFNVDTNAVFIDQGSIDDSGSPFSNNASYDPISYNFNSTFAYFNIAIRQALPLTVPGGPNVLAASRTKIADVYLLIRDKCLFDSLDWRASPPTGAIQKWSGPVATSKTATTHFLLRDSIGGTVQITAASDTLCQGSDVDIAFGLSGEETFNIRFGNGTDSYLAAGINTINAATLYTPTILGEAIYVIDSIQDVNGCWESAPANFVSDTAFIDATVTAANAGTDDSVCVQPKTITLAGNDPTAAFNGTWTANSTDAVFTNASLFNTPVVVDTGGYYYFTWTIRSLIDGALGACPSEEDSVRIRFFRQPSPAIIDSVSYNRCINSLPSNIANIIANPLDTGIGTWSIIGAPGGAVGPFFGDINNDTTSFSTNVQGQYNIQWEITWGNCPTTNDAVQVNFELEAQTPSITTPDGSQCEEIANLVAVDIPLVGNLETWTTTSSAIIAGTTSPTTTATLPTYTFDSTFTFYWNSQNTTIPGVCPIKQDSVKITRLAQPDTTASLNANNTTPACGGVETYTIANVVAGSNYNWILPGGFTITNSNTDSTFIDVSLDDPSFAGNIIIIENTTLGCSGGVDTLFVIPTGCQFEASFSVFPNDTVCVGDEVTLVSNTAGSILGSTQYQWDSTETGGFTTFVPLTTDADTALATFNDPGVWQVQMTASEPTIPPNPAVDDTIVNIVVLGPPNATFATSSISPLCFGDTVEFTVTITGGAPPFTLEIDTLGGGLPITITNYTSGDPIRIVPTQGTSYALSSVSDNFSCSGGLIAGGAFPFIVNALPNLSITTPAFPNLCLGDSISIGFSAPGALPYPNVYITSIGGQENVSIASDPENLFFTPSSTGLFVYSIDSVEDSNGCVSTSAPNINGSATVTVIDGIDSATFVGDTAICLGESTPLTATAFGGNPNYTYYFTGRPDAVQPSPFTFLDTPPATTSYILDSVDDANGCRVFVVDTVTVSVNPLPAATFTRVAPLGNLCLGDTANFDLTFTAGTFPITVDFDNDGASNIIVVNADTTISIPQTAAGTTTYGINSISDANGCSENSFPANISIITNDAPVAGILTGGDAICAGDNDTLNVIFTGGNPVFSITITNIGVITPYVSGDNIIVSPGANTTYTLTNITDGNGCTFDTTVSTTTTVNALPTATIATSTPSICLGSPADIDLTFTGVGPYNVIYTDGVTNYSETGLTSPVTVQVTPLVDSIYNYVLDSIFDTGTGCFIAAPSVNLTGTATVGVSPTTAPSVSIIQSPVNPVCAGDPITFTVNATDTSALPIWQWYQDDLPLLGQNANTLNVPALADGTEIKVELNVSAAGCAAPSIVFDSVIVDVQATVTPSITLVQTPANPVCSNDTLTFDATIVGGGTTPNIVWTIDGTPLPPNDTLSKTITSGFANGSVVRAILNSSFGCAVPGADTALATINVTGSVTPIVSIVQFPGNPICAADTAFFVAQNSGGGATPTFTWFVNGALQVGAVTDTFSYSPRNDLDSISVSMTSAAGCASPGSANDGHIINIETTVTPIINVSQTPSGPVCPGEDVIFDATISGGGTSPSVIWYVDGVLEAISEDFTFFNAAAPGPYTVQGILTSNASCAPGLKTDTFTTTINIQSPVDPSVQIVQNPNNPVCVGDPVNFSVNATGQGSNPTYQWFYEGALVSTSPTYNAPSVADDDEVIVVLTSSNPGSCTSNPIARDTVNIQTESAIPLAGTITSDPVGVQYCPGQTVTFSFQGTGQGSNPSYAWTISALPGIQSTDSSWTYTLPLASPAFYSVAVNVTSSNSCAIPISQPFTAPVIVNPGALPDVEIVQNPGNPVCAGENINFTVNTQNEGTNPNYDWFVNGVFQTSNPGGTFSSSALADGAEVVVQLTTTACSGSATTSDTVIIQHDNPIIPQVEIDVTPDSVLCLNEFVTFTANPSGQGPNPSYTWFVDGTPVSNGSFYTTSFGTAGTRIVVLELNRNQSCGGPTVDRDTMTVDVLTTGTPSVNISRTPAGPICNGDPVTFEASGVHVGLSPTYTWRKNGVIFSIGAVVSTTINNLDDIRVDVSYVNPCSGANSTFAELNNIATSAPGAPSVEIIQDPSNPICPNELIQFTTIDSLEGNSPNYRWYKNGVLEVADPSYTYFATTADDTIIVEMTSSASCATPSTVTDTIITNFIQTDLDTALGDTTTFCFGDSLTLILEDTANVTVEWFSLNSSGADVSLGTADSITLFSTDSVYGLISNGRCSESTDTVLISVYQPYTGSITASGPTDLCFGDQVTLSVDDSTGYTHQWLYGFDSIAGETDTFYIATFSGSFNVIVQNNVCVDTIGAQNVQVAPPIDSTVSILIGDSVFCDGDSVLIGVPSVRGNALGGSLGSSYVQTTFVGVSGNGTRSLEAWLQTDTTGGIMGYGSDANGQAFVVRIQNNSETPGQGNNGALKVAVKNGYITGTTNIADNSPHHVAVVFEGDSVNDIQLFVDGQLETISSISDEAINTGAAVNFRIGTTNVGFTPSI